jgi:diguanylate cyclase (GGDEF)-like protein
MRVPRLGPPPPTGRPSHGAAGTLGSTRLRSRWLGALILLFGVASSLFLAAEWRASALAANRNSAASTERDLINTLSSKLDVNLALTRTMRAIATLEPGATETRYIRWYRDLKTEGNASDNVVATLIEPVRQAQLAAFRYHAESDPAFRRVLGGRFQILPPGSRPVYCLIRAIVGAPADISLYPGLLDYCAPAVSEIGRSPLGALQHAAIDTGSFVANLLPGYGGRSIVAIGAPVYRATPRDTVAARRAASTGSVDTTFDSGAMIDSVLDGHRTLQLALYHRNSGAAPQLLGRQGPSPRNRSNIESEYENLGGGWFARASGTADHPVSANVRGLDVLGIGLLVTLLTLLLYLLLGHSRQRAWGLVGEKTGELAYRSLHDPLTDLPNRGLILDRAEQILARARRLNAPATALFMDIDGFKQINDRYGHGIGDEVLRHVGARLKTVLRDNDTVGRLGGDEFAMLVDSTGLDAAPELVAERILDVLRQPITLPDSLDTPLSISITASIGIATGLPSSAEDLLHDADLALYKAKALGKDRYAIFESAMYIAAQDRMHLEIELNEALAAKQLFLVYQPLLDLESERIVGVEALLRWRHPVNGIIPPDQFIPIAEENGSIIAIGRWVLEQACRQAARWHRQGYAIGISVNVSTRQLEHREFAAEVGEALQKSGLDPAKLTLEITETVLMRKPDATAHLLGELKTLGVRIAVDDFGTGYSSLAYLRQFPVDSLKIDRTFIASLAHSSEAHALTHTLIQLGKALGLQTLAEGVEERSQVRELQREGCDLAQGFLFAKPLDVPELERFLRGTMGPGGPDRSTSLLGAGLV